MKLQYLSMLALIVTAGFCGGCTDDKAVDPVGSLHPPYTTPPELRAWNSPIYPNLALQAGFGGTVGVYVLIDSAGCVAAVQLVTSSGHSSLDAAALTAASGNRYLPALDYSGPVPVWWGYRVAFVLDSGGARVDGPLDESWVPTAEQTREVIFGGDA